MASYVVMEQPGRAGVADVAFVRDGFSWIAFIVPPLWLLWHRLWFEALLAFLAFGVLSLGGEMSGWGLAGSLLTFFVSLYVGLEGQGMRIAALRRRGWRQWGAVEAAGLADAETRYAAEAADEAPSAPQAPRIAPGPAPVRPSHPGLVLGLGPAPGRT
jgi:hypothetical protein